MKKKELKSLKLNKKRISNLENFSGGNPTFGFTISDTNLFCCMIDVTGPCDTSQISEDCLPTEFPCI